MISFACWTAAATAGLILGAGAEPKDNPIFPPDAKLEQVFQRSAKLNNARFHGGLTEGPAAAPDGSIYFTDIPEGPAGQTMIHSFDPRTGKTTVAIDKGSKANGLVFDGDGRLLVCDGADGGQRLVARWNLETGQRTVLADRSGGKRFNSPNDLCVDRGGRIYFTDPRFVGSELVELDQNAVYRIAPDGTLAELTHEVEMPNGIVLSPDERTLYVDDYHSDSEQPSPTDLRLNRGAVRVYAFPLSAEGKLDGQRRTVIDFASDSGSDGMTVDAAGNLYLTCRSVVRPGVMVIDPQGKELAFLPTGPAKRPDERMPSNVEFGVGQDSHSLYVTIDTGLFRIATKGTGAQRVWEAAKR